MERGEKRTWNVRGNADPGHHHGHGNLPDRTGRLGSPGLFADIGGSWGESSNHNRNSERTENRGTSSKTPAPITPSNQTPLTPQAKVPHRPPIQRPPPA